MDSDKPYWIAFSVFPGIGPVRFKLLLDYFGSAKAAWTSPIAVLRSIRLGDSVSQRFDDFRRNFSIESYMRALKEAQVSVLTLTDSRYPILLSRIPDAPFVLYVKGKKTADTWDIGRTIAVVGTRSMSKYGAEVTRSITEQLVAQGFTIVSGLAYGIDAVAHRSAIDSGGKTIAVLGCGIDIIAPPSNAYLYHAIIQGHGAIISEMPLGLRPNKGLFPARNRIISGLSLGVVVTEGAGDSGSLITARFAAEQGREVFAVPGPITSATSKGPAKLLKNGAKLVESVEDIIEELGIERRSSVSPLGKDKNQWKTQDEKKIIECLGAQRMHIDEIVRASGLPPARVFASVTVLELRGVIKDYGEKEYGLS